MTAEDDAVDPEGVPIFYHEQYESMAQEKLEEKEIESLRELFLAFDKDNSG